MAQALDNVADALDFEVIKNALSQERLVNEFAKVTQFLMWPLLALIFKLFFEVRIEGQETFKKVKSPFVIIANHTSFYDSFLFRLVLGFNTPHLPLRFMAVNKFSSKTLNCLARFGIIDFIYSLFGVFTVTPGLGIEKNIEKAKRIVSINGNIVIYPEGSITKTGQVGPFKNGAAVLFKQTGVPFVPVSFRRCSCKTFRQIIFINVGNVLDIPQTRSVEDITNIFHKVISIQHKKGIR